MSVRLDGIVLAAGRSLRMGRAKALLLVGDETFLSRAVRLLGEAGCDAVAVVVAAEDADVAGAAEALGATVVVNPYPGSEQIDSLRLAIGALPRDSAGAVILPVDLPMLRPETVATTVAAWRESNQAETGARAAVPSYGGEAGHPVVLARGLFPALAAPNLPRGLESVLEREAEHVLTVDVDDPGAVRDVDTPAEYEQMQSGAATRAASRPSTSPGPRRFELADDDAASAGAPLGDEVSADREVDQSAEEGDERGAVAPWLSMTRESQAGRRHAHHHDPHSPLSALHAAAVAVTAEAGGPAVAIVAALPPAPFAGQRMAVYDDGRATGSFGDAEVDAAALELARDALDSDEPLTRDIALHGDTRAADEPIVLYAEVHRAPDELLIVGAGHIAVPLAGLGLDMGLRVTVLDDREEFATEERFADGVRVLRADFEHDPFAGVSIGPRTYVTLVTRGHKWDFDCLKRLLELAARPRYIGMIGSRRRVRAAFGALLEAGTPRDELARVHAPIGIEIGAETPTEIAISIAAELILVRRGADPASLTLKERVLDRLLPEEEKIHG